MLPTGPEPAAQRLWLRQGTEPHNGLVAELFSLPVREWNFGFSPRVIVVLRPLGGVDAAAALLLRQSFDLSPAEGEVALAIARGLTRAEIVRGRG